MNKSFGFYCGRFVLFSVLTYAFIFAAAFAAYAFAPDLAAGIFEGGGSSGVGVVTVIVPAMLVAQRFYANESRPMTRPEGWGMAFVFTILAFVISGLVAFASFEFVGLNAAEKAELTSFLADEAQLIMIVGAIIFVMYFLAVRLMLWSGIRGEIKKAERLAAKAARKG